MFVAFNNSTIEFFPRKQNPVNIVILISCCQMPMERHNLFITWHKGVDASRRWGDIILCGNDWKDSVENYYIGRRVHLLGLINSLILKKINK